VCSGRTHVLSVIDVINVQIKIENVKNLKTWEKIKKSLGTFDKKLPKFATDPTIICVTSALFSKCRVSKIFCSMSYMTNQSQ